MNQKFKTNQPTEAFTSQSEVTESQPKAPFDKSKSHWDQKLKSIGWKLLVTAIVGMCIFSSTSIDHSSVAKNALNQGYSTETSIGIILSD